MEHQKSYIYSPPETEERASKRQRTGKYDLQLQLTERVSTYRERWSHQEERIQATLEEADSVTQEKIVQFIAASGHSNAESQGPIPTGLIVAGPSIASHGPFFERLGRRIRDETNSTYVISTSGESPNLKTFLKNLVKKATSRNEDDDDDEPGHPSGSSRKGPKLLDFDLGHVQEWQKKARVESFVVAIQDSEAYDTGLLIEMIDLFYSWLDRLPFVLLFGIATSAENFEDRLSGKSLRYLEGQQFDVIQSDEIVEKLFNTTVASIDTPLRIGPALCLRMLDRQKDHVQDVHDFISGLKYAYMSHFYATYPSIFLSKDISFVDLPSEAFEAVRNLQSFRRFAQQLLDEGHTVQVRKLLDSDQYLFDIVMQQIESGQKYLSALSEATTVLTRIRELLQMTPRIRLSGLWTRAASGEIVGSPLLRETMLLIKKIPSDKLASLLDSLEHFEGNELPIDLEAFKQELDQLIKSNASATPLRSQDDVRAESMRTTVVAQKVLLSKHKAALSEQDKAYSELVGRFHHSIANYFTSAFIDPHTLFPLEILMYDLKSPHTEAFQPKPRYAIERALASPHDYLGCDCCNVEQEADTALGATQPATAILYQLYLESGALINVSDLWSAFHAMTRDDDEESDSKTMALFQRALAELKYLGLVKPSRKKADHVAKTMWKGL